VEKIRQQCLCVLSVLSGEFPLHLCNNLHPLVRLPLHALIPALATYYRAQPSLTTRTTATSDYGASPLGLMDCCLTMLSSLAHLSIIFLKCRRVSLFPVLMLTKMCPSSCSPYNAAATRGTDIAGQLHGPGRTRDVAPDPAVVPGLFH
jgi:hypothetical protein